MISHVGIQAGPRNFEPTLRAYTARFQRPPWFMATASTLARAVLPVVMRVAAAFHLYIKGLEGADLVTTGVVLMMR